MISSKGRIAVVGTGVIGISWAACFLAHGYEVAATDPAPGAEARLRKRVEYFWPAMEHMGLAEGASPERLTFHEQLPAAVEGAVFIQENGPERVEIKRETMKQIDAAAPVDTVIATSSSGIRISDIQDAATHPERILLGHPFNPPHLIPLVEVVGGRLTSLEAIEHAMQFYRGIGKKPILLQKEIKGHIANRLQAALWREAFHLVEQGVASVNDIDTAIAHGPGLRWALLGPFMNLHLSGGEGGIRHVLEHLGPPIEEWWQDLGEVRLTTELIARFAQGMEEEIGNNKLEDIVRDRDAILLDMLSQKVKSRLIP